MEHEDMNQRAEELISLLSSYGIEASPNQIALLLQHLNLVIEKNKEFNLTRIVDLEDALSLHILDSLLPLKLEAFSSIPSPSFVDIGTGAGFPGIPLGIMTGYHGLLIDSVGKKVEADKHFIEQLSLSALFDVRKMRAEELDKSMTSAFGFVIARAVAQTDVLLEYAQPFLKMGGLLIIEKAHPSDDEIAAAARAAALCGMTMVSRETFDLPRDLGHRELLVFKKTGRSKIRLPRPVGIAKSQPLGAQ